MFDLRYVGNHAARLLRPNDFYVPCSPACSDNLAVYTSNTSGSRYNALQFDVTRRLRPDLHFQANYTFSRVLTDSNTITSAFLDPFRDQTNFRLDFGPAAFDVRHAFKANLVYELPFGRGRSSPVLLRGLVSGWSVSGIAVAQSGLPFSILSGADPFGVQTATTLIGGSPLGRVVSFHQTGNGPSIIASSAINSANGTGVAFDANGNCSNVTFSGQVFFCPLLGTPGALQPRSFFGPGWFNLDLALQKRFRITEKQNLEIRVVAVDALNHPAFGFNTQYITFPNFGLNSYLVHAPRTLQFSAYYRF